MLIWSDIFDSSVCLFSSFLLSLLLLFLVIFSFLLLYFIWLICGLNIESSLKHYVFKCLDLNNNSLTLNKLYEFHRNDFMKSITDLYIIFNYSLPFKILEILFLLGKYLGQIVEQLYKENLFCNPKYIALNSSIEIMAEFIDANLSS